MTTASEPDFKTELGKLLKTNRLGKSIHAFDEQDSTQDYANTLPNIESVHGYHSHCKKAKRGQRKNGEKLDFSGGGFMDVDYF